MLLSCSDWASNGHAGDFPDPESWKAIVSGILILDLRGGTVGHNGDPKVRPVILISLATNIISHLLSFFLQRRVPLRVAYSGLKHLGSRLQRGLPQPLLRPCRRSVPDSHQECGNWVIVSLGTWSFIKSAKRTRLLEFLTLEWPFRWRIPSNKNISPNSVFIA